LSNEVCQVRKDLTHALHRKDVGPNPIVGVRILLAHNLQISLSVLYSPKEPEKKKKNLSNFSFHRKILKDLFVNDLTEKKSENHYLCLCNE